MELTPSEKITKAKIRKCRDCKIILDIKNTYGCHWKDNNNICRECSIERAKKWSKENPDKVRERSKKRRKENPEYFNSMRRRLYKENPKYKEHLDKWKKNNPEKVKAYAVKKYKKCREELKQIFGKKCFFDCGRNGRYLHQIEGKEHSFSYLFYIKNRKKFRPLCGFCHKGVHFCLKVLKLDWNSTEKIWRKQK